MTLGPPLAAAATLRRTHGGQQCQTSEVTKQLQLAHVLLDGGIEGVATLHEALAGGDTGLGTVDRLDGELVLVDGEPWRVDWHGQASVMPGQTRTPFAVVSSLDNPRTARLQDLGRDAVLHALTDLADTPGSVVTVEWLSDRGYVGSTQRDGETFWRPTLRSPASRASGRVAEVLDSL